MKLLAKLTTVVVVDDIEVCLPAWEALGHRVSVRVPETGKLGFVILAGKASELMLQTRASLKQDLPEIAERDPGHLLYAETASLARAKKALPTARVIIDERTTFYGAKESWLELDGGVFLGLAEHADS